MVEDAIIEAYYERRENLHAVRASVLLLLDLHVLTVARLRKTVVEARINSESCHARIIWFQTLTTPA